MSLFSGIRDLPTSPMVSTVSRESTLNLVHQALDGGSLATTTNLTANQAYYYPIVITKACKLYKLFCANSATATGNVDVALYRANYTKVVSATPTAMSGATVIQLFDVTNTEVPAGRYYLGMWASSASASFVSLSGATTGRRMALYLTEASLTEGLPATMTPVALSGVTTVLCGFTTIPTF